MTVVTGRIDRIDSADRLISLGLTVIRVAANVSLAGLEPGMSVTVTCEERAGEQWAVEIKRVTL